MYFNYNNAAYSFALFVCGQAQLPWRVSAVQMWRSEDSLQKAALSSCSLKPGAQTRVIGVATRALPGTRPSGFLPFASSLQEQR